MSKSTLKIAIVVSHPIQHFCPQYVSFANNKKIQLRVFFGSALGYKKYTDVNFKEEITWSNLNLDKFDHVFLNGEAVLQPDEHLDAPNLSNALADFDPGLVIVYGYFQRMQRRARRWAIKKNIPLAYISDGEARQKQKPIKGFLKSILLRQYFNPIHFFLTVGDANEAYYARYGVPRNKMVRMHFPIDVKAYNDCFEVKEQLRKVVRLQYNLNSEEIVLVVVGKLSYWKNQDHIIDAMSMLESKGIYATLFVLGSGEMKETYERKGNMLKLSKVYFPGFVSIEALPSFYAAADLYVHPSSVEPHSIAISEAIYMGCPVILSDRCGSYGDTDDVTPGENGFVFEFGNISALAAAIETFIRNQDLRKSYSEASHSRAIAYQHNAHVEVINALTDRLLPQLSIT